MLKYFKVKWHYTLKYFSIRFLNNIIILQQNNSLISSMIQKPKSINIKRASSRKVIRETQIIKAKTNIAHMSNWQKFKSLLRSVGKDAEHWNSNTLLWGKEMTILLERQFGSISYREDTYIWCPLPLQYTDTKRCANKQDTCTKKHI